MRLGSEPLQQPGEHIAFAQLYFLKAANTLEPRTLQDLYQHVYPVFLAGADVTSMLGDWGGRWNFVFQGKPAEWVLGRVNWTFSWWKNGKPTPEQMVRAQDGDRPIGPLEWCPMLMKLGLVAITHSGGKNPFEHAAKKFALSPRPNESEKELLKRLARESRVEAAALMVAAKDSMAMRKRYLVPTPSRSGFEDHVKWAVSFQICNEEVADIAHRVNAESSTVSKGINSVLRMIKLSRRQARQVGRRPKPRKSRA